jgi:hypothetical protein
MAVAKQWKRPLVRRKVAMHAVNEVKPLGLAIGRDTSSERFFQLCYLTAIIVATVGWISAFGFAAVRLASWLMA